MTRKTVGSARAFAWRVAPERDRAQLRDIVQEWLARESDRHVSRSTARRLIVAGLVTANGRVVTIPSCEVRAGTRLEARVDLARLPADPADLAVLRAPLVVLYEDDDLVAVDKPPGLPTVPSADPRRPSVVRELQAQLAARDGTDAARVYLGVHQRLDADTSGVLVFTRRTAANRAMAEAFATHTARKRYLALTVRPAVLPAPEWIVDRPVGEPGARSQEPGARRQEPGPRSQEPAASTRFRVARVLARALLVEARPLTGRKHQVRIHLSTSGLPILGDARYGGPSRVGSIAVPRVMLHAARLEITHPTTGAPLAIDAPLPADLEKLMQQLAL